MEMEGTIKNAKLSRRKLDHWYMYNGRLRPLSRTLQDFRKAFSDFRSYDLGAATRTDASWDIVDDDQLSTNPKILLDPLSDKPCIADFTFSVIVFHCSSSPIVTALSNLT
jgi:hypothetical protein